MNRQGALKGKGRDATARVNLIIDQMLQRIVYRKTRSPQENAKQVFDLFENVIQLADWRTADELKQILKTLGEEMVRRDRMNFVVRNCTERMLKMLKSECERLVVPLSSQDMSKNIYLLRTLSKKGNFAMDDFDTCPFDQSDMIGDAHISLTKSTSVLSGDNLKEELSELQ